MLLKKENRQKLIVFLILLSTLIGFTIYFHSLSYQINGPTKAYMSPLKLIYYGKDHSDDICFLGGDFSGSYYYDYSGKITFWSYGTLKEEFEVPKSSKLCGENANLGYIFFDINEGDVYALVPSEKAEIYMNDSIFEEGIKNKLYCIAHEVTSVKTVDFTFADDCFSSPIFEMEDGTFTVYHNHYGEDYDDPINLTDLHNVY